MLRTGRDWEGVLPRPIAPDCSSGRCAVTVGAHEAGTLVVDHTEAEVLDGDATAARLLDQATFGVTRDGLDAMRTEHKGDAQAWLDAQVAVPATGLRQYLRKRTNPRSRIGTLRSACAEKSRWSSLALDRLDVGKVLMVASQVRRDATTNDTHIHTYTHTHTTHSRAHTARAPQVGSFALSVDGVPRGEINSFNGSASHVVCKVEEVAGGAVELGSADSCDVTTSWSNPIIVLSAPGPEVVVLPGRSSMTDIPDVPNAHLLTNPPADCNLKPGRDSLVSVGGKVYRHDPRLEMMVLQYNTHTYANTHTHGPQIHAHPRPEHTLK